jgi:hypothetical protein
MKKLCFRLPWLILIAALAIVPTFAQPIGAEPDSGEILTRGPVHEAFAGVVSYNPEAGLIVDRQPPEPIEEIPPDERPADADTAWIPGYWGWDDERNDFIWISGTWRVLPPGRAWIAGYWRDAGRGWQWVSGYWEDAARREVTYLEQPPETLERGPSSPPPSEDYEWVPGYWEWRDVRYTWRPGYWLEGRTEWVWVPSYYLWTPRGYVFVDGYWDYAPADRGLLFAPVYYREHRGPRYEYRPSIVLNVAILADYLFLRPRYSHYYFGDYYDSRYESSGIYATFTYQSSRRGYDPFYSYSRWQHRDDRNWEQSYRTSYEYRRQHEDARPPRSWSGSTLTVNVNENSAQIGGRSGRTATYAQSIQQYSRATDSPVRLERTTTRNFQQQAQQVQAQRDQRRTIESQPGIISSSSAGPARRQSSSDRQIGAASRAQTVASPDVARVALPTSPIVAREGTGGRQPPPRAQASRREEDTQARQAERTNSPGAIGAPANQPPRTDAPASRTQRGNNQESVIGAPPAPTPRSEPESQRERASSRPDNSTAVEARRLEQAQQEEQRQAENQARRNVQPSPDQIGAEQRSQPVRERADEQRRAVEAQQQSAQQQQERAAQQQQGRAREEQQRREQERQEQPRGQQVQAQQQQQVQAQQAEARQEQAREQQSRAAEQAQARQQQGRAAEQARERQASEVEQARAQQAQTEQARTQQAQAADQAHAQQAQAEQARAQQSQATEQAEQQRAQAAEQARDQQAKAAGQAQAVRAQAAPNRGPNQPPQKKAPPPPKAQSDEEERRKAQADEEERKKGKGDE